MKSGRSMNFMDRNANFYDFINIDELAKSSSAVIPAQAGIQKLLKRLDPPTANRVGM
jgi:hypothetical protein